MDLPLRRLSRAIPHSQLNGNATQPMSLTDLPPTILEAIVPGYGLITRYAQAFLGIDISLFVSIAVIFLAATKGGQFIYTRVSRAFMYLLTSSVFIGENDDLFDMMMDWLAKTQPSASERKVRAKTQRGQKAENEFEMAPTDLLSEDGYFDYNKWSARVPPRYEPYYGRHFVWYSGRFFIVRRSHKPKPEQSIAVLTGQGDRDDIIQIDCIGRSVDPIKDLLKTVKAWSVRKLRNTTTVRHPTPKENRRGGAWSKTFSRPSRPMDTVILEAEQKAMILKDMNDYLHPDSPKWYATRGIPYRRGYLFHGPPGTGKTSLSFALAGIFGLEIYVISLQEPSLTEADLMHLFNSLPRRCIVLLEDVDAAGLVRDGKGDADDEDGEDGSKSRMKRRSGRRGQSKAKSKEEEPNTQNEKANEKADEKPNGEDYTLKDLARELKSLGGGARRRDYDRGENHGNGRSGTNSGISLSGLLNAIDGVATHEGRVLIMTTNHPEKLDSALVRPGRVDRKVEFTYAMTPEIRELFIRMYSASKEQPDPKAKVNGAGSRVSNGSANGHIDEKLSNGQAVEDVRIEHETTDLEELAAEFAGRIPVGTYTPAEIQNHLMMYKDDPKSALDNVDDWMKETDVGKEKESSESSDDNSYEEVDGEGE